VWALAGVVRLAVLTRGFRRLTPQLAVDHTREELTRVRVG